ncbi:MAG: polyhydroxyalkanoate biosynthesis repressor PhaR [Rhodobiaceae bacterium]|nr:polyhydroxyalkanoate biosynthesis repressor PhaR [Rhodobiaceae bacterium]RPF97271.1 MAG: polyhydroxyalkanoate biosynthesis repressor PhaR [Rhizobiales bacterium TMED227]|tara:strand:+ start:28 stop:1056 length:1029 start_codon:yes stop_codon:yes gene_type:complete
MKIRDRVIGPNQPPLVIAEIGINHGGNLSVAKEMVRLAASSGCECVKHQTHFVQDEMTKEAREIKPPNADKSIWEIMSECSLTRSEEIELKKYSEDIGLIWISTPFSRSAADFLEEIDVPAFKIGSGEADNLPLIRHIAKKGKPIILSTGMQSISSIKKTVAILDDFRIEYALLECTNLYPSPPETISLRGISELSKAFPNAIIGYSDHSVGPEMALASVALGANIVERHFTDTFEREGPDISCSMDPKELEYLINKSKEIHFASRNPKKRTLLEEEVYKFARASIVADRDIKEGQIIEEKDIWARRPGNGEIPGYEFDNIIGKKTNRDLKKNEQIKWDDLS